MLQRGLIVTAVSILVAVLYFGCVPGPLWEAVRWLPQGEYYRLHEFNPAVEFNTGFFNDLAAEFDSLQALRTQAEKLAGEMGGGLGTFRKYVRLEPFDERKLSEYFGGEFNPDRFRQFSRKRLGSGEFKREEDEELRYWTSDDGSGLLELRDGLLLCNSAAMKGVERVLRDYGEGLQYDGRFGGAQSLIDYRRGREYLIQWENLDPILGGIVQRISPFVKNEDYLKSVRQVDYFALDIGRSSGLEVFLMVHFRDERAAKDFEELLDEHRDELFKALAPEFLGYVVKWADVARENVSELAGGLDYHLNYRNRSELVITFEATTEELKKHLRERRRPIEFLRVVN